jgi:hypothetical protein
LSGQDDWELSYTGYMADEKFEELLTLEEVSWDDFERLGFTQYYCPSILKTELL